MKRCSQCWEVYDDSFKFCERDGKPLLTVTGQQVSTEQTADQDRTNNTAWITGLIGLMSGIVLCLAVFAVYTFVQMRAEPDKTEEPTFTSQRQQPVQRPHTDQPPAREVEEASDQGNETEPAQEASPEPSPAETKETNQGRLNQGPVSTGHGTSANNAAQTVIEMTDGSSLVVDAAWQDAQGVWYRRGGLVSYIETQRVKAITARAEPKTAPAVNQ